MHKTDNSRIVTGGIDSQVILFDAGKDKLSHKMQLHASGWGHQTIGSCHMHARTRCVGIEQRSLTYLCMPWAITFPLRLSTSPGACTTWQQGVSYATSRTCLR